MTEPSEGARTARTARMAPLRYVLVDVFSEVALAGNQLAVFTDGRGLDEALMQSLARELNLSETVFVLPAESGGDARIRIFTPATEVPFAGHPTLGTAFVLGAPLQRDVIRLETGSGTVPVALERDESGRIVFGRMTQPVPAVEPFHDPGTLLAGLGLTSSELPVEVYDNGIRHVFVGLADAAALAALRPDLAALAAFGALGVNCFAPAGARWRTRMFGPGLGIAEDPASGSAAGPLACHLARHGRVAWGDEIVIEQGVEMGRASRLHARAEERGGLVEKVEVGGAAVIVARGEFRL